MQSVWIAAGLAAAPGLAAAIGAMLPVRHRTARRACFRASPNALYAVLAGPPDWRTGVKDYGELADADGRRRWWEEDSHGHKVTYELVGAAPGKRLQTRIAQPGLPFAGTWTFEIAPLGDGGSELRITEDGEIYNVFFRFLARFVFGYSGSIELYLRDLGAKFGQKVEIES
ncbi:MAG TPA: SRPBCC family protein [Bryobacteraceae bacterium]|jgi:hypothetical protein|nr:SRPBCC family protein [Bryobacteraceae bacterium]